METIVGETGQRKFQIEFGGMSDPLLYQLKKQGLMFDKEQVRHFQRLANSIIPLLIAGILSLAEHKKCQQRLFGQIQEHVNKNN